MQRLALSVQVPSACHSKEIFIRIKEPFHMVRVEPYLPLHKSIPSMKKAVQSCKGCDLYKNAT